jgi:restriction system protein
MKSHYRLMLGKRSSHASECLEGGFIGTDFGIHQDLDGKLPDQWREFNRLFIPVYLENNPDKTKIGAGLACGALWTVSKGINIGDLVLCPDGSGRYRVGEVLGDYYYASDRVLPHRRKVRWLDSTIDRAAMSEALRNSSGSIGTVCNLSSYKDEIEGLVDTATPPSATLLTTDFFRDRRPCCVRA